MSWINGTEPCNSLWISTSFKLQRGWVLNIKNGTYVPSLFNRAIRKAKEVSYHRAQCLSCRWRQSCSLHSWFVRILCFSHQLQRAISHRPPSRPALACSVDGLHQFVRKEYSFHLIFFVFSIHFYMILLTFYNSVVYSMYRDLIFYNTIHSWPFLRPL